MREVPRMSMVIYVDRTSHQWVIRDPDGKFWLIPATEEPWEKRQPFYPTSETILEPVPGHYRSLIGLPF